MAGGKETPRQKMIGMMYLVLTALLALNVSKQIVAAFITLNDKLDLNATNIDERISSTYLGFDQKEATLKAQRANMDYFNLWQTKALDLKKSSAELVGFLLGECNDMIKTAEGEDWIAMRDENGNISRLKSLEGIENMDDYDIPTNMFVGGNPQNPDARGMEIVNRIHAFRDLIVESMATYPQGSKRWSFKAPQEISGLNAALATANPKDTASLARFYKSLTLPEYLHAHGEDMELPWISVTFDHAPIVAAAAMFTSLKLDVKNAQAFASEYMLAKVEAPPFPFNKIDPLAFASSGYINQGDSLSLSVMIAAYDSTEISKIRWGMDADTANPAAWTESSGRIGLDGSRPGFHKVKGEIAVRERGEVVWKPWDFSYTVGQPMGVVAQPEMRVLYWGYPNVVEGAASGFPADRVSLSTSSGCTLESMGNGKYKVNVTRGTRGARINVSGRKDDGSSVSLGSFEYVCKPLPPATIYFGSAENGGTITYTEARNLKKVRVDKDPSCILTALKYTVVGGSLYVSSLSGVGTFDNTGTLDQKGESLMNQSKGKTVSIEIKYRDMSGATKIETLMFKVQP
jgi:hypothetical protein